MSARALWAHPDARSYLTGQTLSLLGDSALWLACGIWVKTLTGSDTAAALTFLFFTAPALLAPLAGLLADRVRRRPLLIAANLAGAVVLAPLLLVRDRGDVWVIYGVMTLYGLLNVSIAPAQSALLTVLLPANLLADANATLRTVQEGIRIVAPLAGAGLFAFVGGQAVVALDMASFVGAAALTARIRVVEPRPSRLRRVTSPPSRPVTSPPLRPVTGSRTAPMRRIAGQIGAGFRFLADVPALRRLTLASAVTTLFVGAGDATSYAVIGQGLHRAPEFIAVTQVIHGVGAILGGLTAAPAIRRLGEIRTVVVGLMILAVTALCLATPWLPTVLAGKLGVGAALPWIVIAIITLLQRQAAAHLQGRVYAAFEVCATGPQTAGLALGAAVIAFVDYRVVLISETLGLLVAAAMLARTRLPTEPPSAESPVPEGTGVATA
ncbi:MFS transporter [Actinoplanes sp. TBRC 11911]|uniref:MFS transporter n=1 Tax=Actinoplanes sp. TBRC 11911 TaxID=2729386 RepID=UPI00145C456A|nr:MFS transporter [Actinoplanes sp. TBRC 11911]NMO51598.1 MFS transporter [Actinoplanes sp. TBRC 11911]